MLDFIKDNSILIIPNNIKENIIKNIRINNKTLNIKVFSLEEFINNLTYTYNEETIYNLMKQENINYNISLIYLNNIKYIDSNSNIPKLNKLKTININIKPKKILTLFFLAFFNNFFIKTTLPLK